MLKLKEILFALIGFTSSLVLLKIGNNSAFKIILFLSLVVMFFSGNCSFSVKDVSKKYLLGHMLLCVTTVSAILFSVGHIWVNQAIVQFFWITIYFFFYLLASSQSSCCIVTYFRFFYLGGFLQIVWGIFQFIFYSVKGVNINFILFPEFFEKKSFSADYIKEGMFGASGIAWHPSNFAPLLVLMYWMSSNIYMRALAVLVGFMTCNSTVIIGVTLCVCINIMTAWKNISLKAKKKNFVLTIGFVLVLFFVLFSTDVLNLFNERFSFLFSRFMGTEVNSSSTDAHMRYYTSIPDVIFSFSPLKTFLGFGEGCSGYTMTMLRSQYAYFGAWAVECDIVNVLWNRGMVGFLIFFSWLFSLAQRGKKINQKYFRTIFIVFCCGFFYNIQYDWVIVTELLIDLAVRKNIDVFKLNSYNRDKIYE